MDATKVRLRRLAFRDDEEAKLTQDEEKRLIEAARKGDVKAYHKVLAAHVTTIDVHVNRSARFLHSPSAVDELYPVGIQSVDKCIRGFDLDSGYRFITYLDPAVRRDIVRYVREARRFWQRHPEMSEGIEPERVHTNAARVVNQYHQTLLALLTTILSPDETFALKVHYSAKQKGTYADMQQLAASHGIHKSIEDWGRTYHSARKKAEGIKRMLDSLDQ